VATQLAHDYPWWVRYLVLVNSLGGPVWDAKGAEVRLLADRPLWSWGWRLPMDLVGMSQVTRALPAVLEDLVPNVLANPVGLWRVANLARGADLTAELEQLRRRHLPVVALCGSEDRVIPRASFDALCAAIGADGEVVAGSHSWLLADPDHFGQVMTNALAVARLGSTGDFRTPRPRRGGR
jgi:pimeloyl-ACP methyl ester carboxylesterase